jgi:hypothetical protein
MENKCQQTVNKLKTHEFSMIFFIIFAAIYCNHSNEE